MINRKNLKKGDEVSAIYVEGYATEGIVVPMVVKKVGKDYVVAAKKTNGSEFKFIGDDLIYEGVRFSSCQRFNLFLGTVKEAEEYNKQRENIESLYSNNQELIFGALPKMSIEDLNTVIELAKKYYED